MDTTRAHRIAGALRYAAIQFIVLTACAMIAYAGGNWFDRGEPRYVFTENFLSDLGATRAWSGRSNYLSSALFFLALSSIGAALVAFAWTWRTFAFARARAPWAGHASALLGTASGLCFVGIAVTPFNLALAAHNLFVLAAFGLLLAYAATLTLLMWRNAIGACVVATSLGYVALVVAYVVLIVFGPRLGTRHGAVIQVTGQKIIAYGSMVYVIYLATFARGRPLPRG